METPNLLVPVDGSPTSSKAAEYAIKMARLMKLPVLVVHCHKSFPAILGEPYYQQAIDAVLGGSRDLVAEYEAMFKEAGIECEALLIEGNPGFKICEVAEIEKSEMIVMGSRGRTDLQGLLLGSVAHKVLHGAPCPVLVVR